MLLSRLGVCIWVFEPISSFSEIVIFYVYSFVSPLERAYRKSCVRSFKPAVYIYIVELYHVLIKL